LAVPTKIQATAEYVGVVAEALTLRTPTRAMTAAPKASTRIFDLRVIDVLLVEGIVSGRIFIWNVLSKETRFWSGKLYA
jgi:hypothetical protein